MYPMQADPDPHGALKDVRAENARLRAALNAAADRFDDVATIIERDGSYTNIGFFRASARRCREVDFYSDEQTYRSDNIGPQPGGA